MFSAGGAPCRGAGRSWRSCTGSARRSPCCSLAWVTACIGLIFLDLAFLPSEHSRHCFIVFSYWVCETWLVPLVGFLWMSEKPLFTLQVQYLHQDTAERQYVHAIFFPMPFCSKVCTFFPRMSLSKHISSLSFVGSLTLSAHDHVGPSLSSVAFRWSSYSRLCFFLSIYQEQFQQVFLVNNSIFQWHLYYSWLPVG